MGNTYLDTIVNFTIQKFFEDQQRYVFMFVIVSIVYFLTLPLRERSLKKGVVLFRPLYEVNPSKVSIPRLLISDLIGFIFSIPLYGIAVLLFAGMIDGNVASYIVILSASFSILTPYLISKKLFGY